MRKGDVCPDTRIQHSPRPRIGNGYFPCRIPTTRQRPVALPPSRAQERILCVSRASVGLAPAPAQGPRTAAECSDFAAPAPTLATSVATVGCICTGRQSTRVPPRRPRARVRSGVVPVRPTPLGAAAGGRFRLRCRAPGACPVFPTNDGPGRWPRSAGRSPDVLTTLPRASPVVGAHGLECRCNIGPSRPRTVKLGKDRGFPSALGRFILNANRS